MEIQPLNTKGLKGAKRLRNRMGGPREGVLVVLRMTGALPSIRTQGPKSPRRGRQRGAQQDGAPGDWFGVPWPRNFWVNYHISAT